MEIEKNVPEVRRGRKRKKGEEERRERRKRKRRGFPCFLRGGTNFLPLSLFLLPSSPPRRSLVKTVKKRGKVGGGKGKKKKRREKERSKASSSSSSSLSFFSSMHQSFLVEVSWEPHLPPSFPLPVSKASPSPPLLLLPLGTVGERRRRRRRRRGSGLRRAWYYYGTCECGSLAFGTRLRHGIRYMDGRLCVGNREKGPWLFSPSLLLFFLLPPLPNQQPRHPIHAMNVDDDDDSGRFAKVTSEKIRRTVQVSANFLISAGGRESPYSSRLLHVQVTCTKVWRVPVAEGRVVQASYALSETDEETSEGTT